jgi:RNA polymerase sigma-70 factor, ECF subfamily
MHTTSPSLLQQIRSPTDQAAWERFVNLYTPLIYRWVRRGGVLEQDAADLVQDVLTTLVREMREFEYDPNKSFRSWLRTIALHKWRDYCRRKSAAPEIQAMEMSLLLGPSEDDDFADEEYRCYLVARALQLMKTDFEPNTWKACFERVVEGRPAADVAAELGMTENAVFVAQSKVLRRLREDLEGLWE